MTLRKIQDYDPNYQENIFANDNLKSYEIYTSPDGERVGTVHNILVDDSGHLRYFVIDTGFWIFGKKVLLPIGLCNIDYPNHRVYASDLTKEQVEQLPEYREDMTIDRDYEDQVRRIYRGEKTPVAAGAHREHHNEYRYDQDPDMYEVRETDHGNIKLYEERLIADKHREKVGEVAVGKTVETETARAAVPVENERVVIERKTPTDAGKPVTPGDTDFQEGEVARLEIHEETADIHKEAFVSEEVSVTKETERDTVTDEETLRREELDIDVEGNPKVKRTR